MATRIELDDTTHRKDDDDSQPVRERQNNTHFEKFFLTNWKIKDTKIKIQLTWDIHQNQTHTKSLTNLRRKKNKEPNSIRTVKEKQNSRWEIFRISGGNKPWKKDKLHWT